MASDADAVRKDLKRRGYDVQPPSKRGRAYYDVVDPKTDKLIARFPTHPSTGSWRANLDAAIRRYERTGVPGRSSRRGGE